MVTFKLIEEKEKAVVVNDALTTERLAYWKQRRYLSLPIDSMVITSHYGKRKDPFTGKIANHRGIDLKGNNDYVYSIMPGMVVKTGKNNRVCGMKALFILPLSLHRGDIRCGNLLY